MRVLLKSWSDTPKEFLTGGIFEPESWDEHYYYFNGFSWPQKFAEVVDLDELCRRHTEIGDVEQLLGNLPISDLRVKFTFGGFGILAKQEKVIDLSPQAEVRLRELVDADLREQLRKLRNELKSF